MSVASADIMKSINAAWNASTLDATFKALWPDPTDATFPVMHDQEASPGQPFPYCVAEQFTGNTTDRMSGGPDSLREVRESTVRFHIHTMPVDGDLRSEKEIAAYLAEEMMKVFGGHPTVAPTATLALDNGNVLWMKYENDFGIRPDETYYEWLLHYAVMSDVPVMA